MKTKVKSIIAILVIACVLYCFKETICHIWDISQAPRDISTHGPKIADLFNYTTIMNIFYFILVCIGLFGFSYFYSAKRNKTPYYTHGYTKKQKWVTTVIGIGVFLTIDMAITAMSNNDLLNVFWKWPDPKQEKVLKVQVLAQQWAWNFRYAGTDGIFNTDDDVVTLNDLRVPKDTKILFHLTSKDVIHSFYVPNVKIKVDTIPGRITRIWWDAVDKTVDGKTVSAEGVYDIACAEMCGTHHYLMKAQLTVYNQEDFNAWLDEAQRIAIATNDPENLDMYWGWRWDLTKAN